MDKPLFSLKGPECMFACFFSMWLFCDGRDEDNMLIRVFDQESESDTIM